MDDILSRDTVYRIVKYENSTEKTDYGIAQKYRWNSWKVSMRETYRIRINDYSPSNYYRYCKKWKYTKLLKKDSRNQQCNANYGIMMLMFYDV